MMASFSVNNLILREEEKGNFPGAKNVLRISMYEKFYNQNSSDVFNWQRKNSCTK